MSFTGHSLRPILGRGAMPEKPALRTFLEETMRLTALALFTPLTAGGGAC